MIPHLPQSRDRDLVLPEEKARICTQFTSQLDRIIIEEKLDGSPCAITRQGPNILALTQDGIPAHTSQYSRHGMFHDWVQKHAVRFRFILNDQEYLYGDWLAQAIGTKYTHVDQPFVPTDFVDQEGNMPNRWVFYLRTQKINLFGPPQLLPHGATPPRDAIRIFHKMTRFPQSEDEPEGVIYRVERMGKERFRAQYVRPDKQDGIYLPEKTGASPVWNWTPEETST